MGQKNRTFDRFVAEQLRSPSFAAEYERAGIEIRAVDDLIRGIEMARNDLDMTKADLARRVSTTPEAMRRLLTSHDANPTLRTVLHVLDALGLRLTVVPQLKLSGLSKRASEPRATPKRQQRRTA